MKKLISVLLLICTITTCLSSCGGKNDNNNNDNGNNDNTPTCDTTGVHTYEQGECTGCGLKVFDVIKDYCIEHGEENFVNQSLVRLGTQDVDNYYVILYCDIDKDNISISCYHDLFHKYYLHLEFTPYVFEDGGYEWSAGCGEWDCDCPSISGFLDPSKFSSSTNCLTYSSSAQNAEEIAKYGTWALQHGIEEYLINFLNDVGHNISIGDLGFVRYE